MAGGGGVKILELGKFYPPERGGIETLLRLWSEGFVRLGGTVECVVANGPKSPGARWRTLHETVEGVRVHRLPSFGEVFSTSACPAYPLAAWNWRADIIHAHFPNPLADLAVVLAPRKIPVVLSWHSDIVRQKAVLRAYLPLQRALLRRADRIVVATPHHLEYSPWLPEFRHKVVVIPFGLELERFRLPGLGMSKVAELRAQAQGRTILLNVGRLVGYKGQRFAIEALRDVPGAELWLVGTGPLEAELRETAAQAGVTDRVRFCGDVADADLPAYFNACDIFVFPSVTPNEAFGLVQVEAMACGKPIVACNLRSGVPYVCADGLNGLVVPPSDSPALAAALNRLVASPSLQRQLGEAGRVRSDTEFSSPVMVQRYWNLFSSLRLPGALPA